MAANRPSLFLHLLMRKLNEGMSFTEASDWALAGVADAYRIIVESHIGPPALHAVEHGDGRRRADAA